MLSLPFFIHPFEKVSQLHYISIFSAFFARFFLLYKLYIDDNATLMT